MNQPPSFSPGGSPERGGSRPPNNIPDGAESPSQSRPRQERLPSTGVSSTASVDQTGIALPPRERRTMVSASVGDNVEGQHDATRDVLSSSEPLQAAGGGGKPPRDGNPPEGGAASEQPKSEGEWVDGLFDGQQTGTPTPEEVGGMREKKASIGWLGGEPSPRSGCGGSSRVGRDVDCVLLTGLPL